MNATQRLLKTIAWAAENGVKAGKVPKAVAAERMKICRGCESFIKPTAQCGECLCFLKVKTALIWDPVESVKQMKDIKVVCPREKWGEYIEVS